MITSMIKLFDRDLSKFRLEVASYSNEENFWKVTGQITNSGGVLTKHLIGNLNHFIGAIIGETGYVRNREFEFTAHRVERETLLSEIEKLQGVIRTVLMNFPAEKLNSLYPIEVLGGTLTYEFFLIHLAGHLNYHLGQINYHRRLVDH